MANAPPWTPDQPLRADATDGQLHDRIAWLERDSGLYIRGGRRAAREYAAACVEAKCAAMATAEKALYERIKHAENCDEK